MKRFVSILLGMALLWSTSLSAQQKAEFDPGFKNLIKLNLSSLVVSTVTVQYERVLSKSQSIALTIGYTPNVPLPFKQTLLKDYGGNSDASRAILTSLFSKFTTTLEYRFYVGGKAPKGFYIAPFLRYMNMSLSNNYTFTPSDEQLHTAHLTANFSGFGGGILLGYQFLVSKRVAIDWWILGPFWGTQIHANFLGTDPKATDMSEQDRENVIYNIQGVKLPLFTANGEWISETQLKATMVGPYYGVRAMGICIAIRF